MAQKQRAVDERDKVVEPGTDEFKAEAIKSYRRQHWRRNYLLHREEVLARQRRRQAERKQMQLAKRKPSFAAPSVSADSPTANANSPV
jgi:hypothetical protein